MNDPAPEPASLALLLFGLIFAVLALAGIVTSVLAARAVGRFAARPPAIGPAIPASVLKPLHGLAPRLAETLAAAQAQHHAAPFEILSAVHDPDDPAAAIAEAVLGEGAVVRDQMLHGPNRKVSQLENLAPRARYPVLVVADDDIRVPPDWLTAVTAPLADPAVGLVTCLYSGEPAADDVWSRLGGLGIDWHFLPNAILGEDLGRAYGCYGATMALRAETLRRIGGFRALAGLLADDHALGVAVRRLGLRIVLAPVLPAHVMAEAGPLALLRHELRWARTVRLLDPRGYAGMAATHPLPFGLLALLLLPWPVGGALLAAALAARLWLVITVDRGLLARRLSARRLALLPLRDSLGLAIWLGGLARGTVLWQGRRYRMDPDGRMVEVGRREGLSTP